MVGKIYRRTRIYSGSIGRLFMEDINKTLDEAISTRDIKSIRNILVTGIAQDPGFNNGILENELKYCFDSKITKEELFEPFEGDLLNEDQNIWTKDYYAEQRTEFRYNFSFERFEHLKKLGKKLYPSKNALSNEQSEHDDYSPSLENKDEKRKYKNTECISTKDKENEGIPNWLIPAGIGAVALFLLWLIFGRK